MGMVKAWSFSRWLEYSKCPFAYKCSAIDKIPQPSNYAIEYGELVHAKGRSFLQGIIKSVPAEFSAFTYEMKEIRRLGASAEVDLAITKKWAPTVYNDWDNVWCRGSADALIKLSDTEASVIDYKTGKRYDYHDDQVHLYAALMFARYEVEYVQVELWYTRDGETVVDEYTRSQYPRMKKDWEARVKPMFRDTKFLPVEGDHCRWCNFSKTKGGPCPIR